jgi:hypothetical protein
VFSLDIISCLYSEFSICFGKKYTSQIIKRFINKLINQISNVFLKFLWKPEGISVNGQKEVRLDQGMSVTGRET